MFDGLWLLLRYDSCLSHQHSANSSAPSEGMKTLRATLNVPSECDLAGCVRGDNQHDKNLLVSYGSVGSPLLSYGDCHHSLKNSPPPLWGAGGG